MGKAQIGVWMAMPLVGLALLFMFVAGPFWLLVLGFAMVAVLVGVIVASV